MKAVRLGDLPIGSLFIIPGHTDELPTDATGSGRHYLYRVSSRRTKGQTRVFNKDLRTLAYYSNNAKVIKQ